MWANIEDMAETDLEMAERHVSEQKGRIVNQYTLIGRLRDARIPTGEAEKVLDQMNDLLLILQDHVRRLKAP